MRLQTVVGACAFRFVDSFGRVGSPALHPVSVVKNGQANQVHP